MVLWPSSFVIVLAYIVLFILPPCWYVMVTRIEQHVNLNSKNVLSQFQSEIEHSATLIHPMNSSSTNFARFMSSTLKTTNISFSEIETKVAPLLFQAFETVPHLAQISYIGMDGHFFSYYTDHDQAMAMYSNASSSSNSTWGTLNTTVYYIQPVNRDTGELYGEAIKSNSSINASGVAEAINSSYGYASLGTKWNNGHDLLFISSARITRTGVISLGFPAKSITNFLTPIGHLGASLYLATKDGQVLVEGIHDTRMIISNDTVSFQSVNANDDQTSTVSCKGGVVASILNIRDVEYLIHCSPIDIMGIKSVYVLAIPQNALVRFVLNIKKIALALLTVMMVTTFIAIVCFLFINTRSARREMQSMNKSLALAKASHDIRAGLAVLTGLIDQMSYEEVVSGSELQTNLKQMDSCTKDLLGLLNNILDASKIEAGKMRLEEEEFDIFQLLEEVVDLYHPVAMKKGVDLVLDPCNGSLLRYSRVKGDRGKLKQVFSNLLSNAIKFTDEGYIAVRAWAQKSSIITTNRNSFRRHLSRLFYRKNEAHRNQESMNSMQQDPSYMNFTFEVDDTGKGIPKEKYKSIFENYVQVKETALGQGGTGLGLGIVQSLVRLMHGDVGIVDKDIGEKGTCFRFNVVLTACETGTEGSTREGQFVSGDRTIHTNSSTSSTYSMTTPRLLNRSPSPRPEASRVVLLIQGEERQRTTQRFMESLGIKVKVVIHLEDLSDTLMNIKQKGKGNHSNSQSCSPFASHNSTSRAARGVSSSAIDGIDYINSIFKKTDVEATPGFVLIVIDANAGPFSELSRMVSDFRSGLRNPCRVVWLEEPHMRGVNFETIIDEDVSNSNDVPLYKPFHGSRLFQVIRFLPEYGGAWKHSSSGAKRERGNELCGEIQECGDSSNNDKPLSGMKFLVVEDTRVLRTITRTILERLGASIEECENGEQALRLVEEGLTRGFQIPPYDYILMDCEMPVMDGYEATRQIREMEKPYDVHFPIIALTANTEESTKISIEAGMDHHLVKPIIKEVLLEAIRSIHRKE
ncbi:histidine kinase CKI1-like [Gastrolobium bilobum]|uniref:histidine kinase CKI1-like n=1 Tax=Gastrolobium bilobum TaxID=150636 RepID=UPI002AB0FB17|nr:histidine kinase CKI1-like [Gastrolobium bilobum]